MREWITAATQLVVRAAERGALVLKDRLHIPYHILIVLLSAAIAASLPLTFSFAAQRLLGYWAFIENEKLFLVSTEVAIALLLIAIFSHARTNWRNRKYSKMARVAGLVHLTSRKGVLARLTPRRRKERQAFMHDIMVIGSTGFRTLVDPKGDLHTAIESCRTAKIMLLNPAGRGALERARTIPIPEVSYDSLRRQVKDTIAFLRALRARQKSIQLKLYPDPPLWKLAILGDYAWVQHYHPGIDVQGMPEYVFGHAQDPTGLFSAFYQYFVTRWNDPAIPEYDLLGGELVFKDGVGNEFRRETLDSLPENVTPPPGKRPSVGAGTVRGCPQGGTNAR